MVRRLCTRCHLIILILKPVTPTNKVGKPPVDLAIHENHGLNPYIKDVARRLAKAGFIAFVTDVLLSIEGYPGNDDEGRAMQTSMDKYKIQSDFVAAAEFLKSHKDSNGKLGVEGFCFCAYMVS